MSDEPDITPPHGIPAIGPGPQPAAVREGRHVAPPDPGRLPAPESDLWANLEAMRHLFRVSFNAFQEAAYPQLAPGIALLEQRVQACIRDKLKDDELLELWIEIKDMLRHRRLHG